MKRRERATVTAVGLLAAAYNVAVNRVLPQASHVPANLAVAITLTTLGRKAAHASWSDLGLGRAQFRRGLDVGIRSSLVSAALVGAALVVPKTRPFFADERVLKPSSAAAAYEVGVRIPFATALPEEIVFRGVLLGVLSRSHSAATSIAWTSTLFGLWHLLPTLEMMRTNPAGDLLPKGPVGPTVALGGVTLATGAAGVGFAWMRNRSGSVLAPFMAHTTLNAAAYLGGRAFAAPGRLGVRTEPSIGRSSPGADPRSGRSMKQRLEDCDRYPEECGSPDLDDEPPAGSA